MTAAFGANPGDNASIDETTVAAGMVREILEAVCARAGISLDSDVEPGSPARNYELALRLRIGHVFGIGDAASMTAREPMRQVAPYPQALADLVAALRYRRHLGWRVWLEDDLQRDKPGRHSGESRGMTLVVQRAGPNTYHPDEHMAVNHYFAVPPATYNRQSWMRWLFDRLGDVDTHERMEDFTFWPRHRDGTPFAETPPGGEEPALERPLAPCHGPGWDPYVVTYERADTDRRTSFRGVLDDDGTGQPKQA